ncbi:MAG: Na/Pi cotransporter family protein [Verrucomicrobiae bacterium]|nr:Na/Pi cotransporter family protein [Verrucomicrobiae bacterium]
MEDSPSFLTIGTGLFGGLALFLYGMHTMSEGLKLAAGDGMRALLGRLTTNRFTAAASGALVTAVIQSSSVTTVLVVGFVSAGLMTLGQSVGVIMGANIGTTITAQIVAFKITAFSWVLVAAGFAVWTFPRRQVVKEYGAMILGLGLLFIGMDQMSEATDPLRTYPPFIQLMSKMDSPLFGIFLGAAFTALVQSSSATTGIVIMLASQGFLTLEAGITLALGSNIGTCITAILSALGKPPVAMRTAVVHVLFNVIGALLWVGFIDQLGGLAREISPSRPDLDGMARLVAETPRQVANANTLFNVTNTLILIWFVNPIAHLASKIVPEKKVTMPAIIEPKFLDKVYLATPSLALDRARMELVHMGECVTRMIVATPDAWRARDRWKLQRLAEMDEDVDRLHLAILDYLNALGRGDLSTSESSRLEQLLSIANYMESTGDLIGTDFVAQGMHTVDHSIATDSATTPLRPAWSAVAASAADVLSAIESGDVEIAREVIHRKAEIHSQIDQALKSLGLLMKEGKMDLEGFRITVDLVGLIKRLYYNVRKVAQVLVRGAEGSPDSPVTGEEGA